MQTFAVEIDPLVAAPPSTPAGRLSRLAGSTSCTSCCTIGFAVVELERRQ